MIYDEIKKANVQAMKDKDTVARSFYSVLLNKIKLEEIRKREKGEALVDGDVFSILQKTIKELTDEKKGYEKVGNEEEVKNITTQMAIAEKYLPKMMSDEEIKNAILALDDKSVPSVMKHFKANYAGLCDMRKVQEILKGLQ